MRRTPNSVTSQTKDLSGSDLLWYVSPHWFQHPTIQIEQLVLPGGDLGVGCWHQWAPPWGALHWWRFVACQFFIFLTHRYLTLFLSLHWAKRERENRQGILFFQDSVDTCCLANPKSWGEQAYFLQSFAPARITPLAPAFHSQISTSGSTNCSFFKSCH